MGNYWLTDTITTTFYNGVYDGLTDVLRVCYQGIERKKPCRRDYGNGILMLWDSGGGYSIEQWYHRDLVAKSINYGNLDISSSEIFEVEVCWEYGDFDFACELSPKKLPRYISSPELLLSRKFRWTLEAEFPGAKMKPHFVRISGRPRH